MGGLKTRYLVNMTNNLSIRHAFFEANSVWMIMVALSCFSTQLSETGDTTLVYPAIACLLYLSNFMECGDDITAVCESIRSGLLAAFVNGSSHFSDSRLVPTGMHTTV